MADVKKKPSKKFEGGSVIDSCICQNVWQDEHCGIGKRVHNKLPKGTKRCTVCGRVS
jgi:hypothetical protein